MPLWLLLKPFWKHIILALAVVGAILYVRHAWNERYEDGFKEGVAVTEDKQAEVIAERMLENEKQARQLALLVQSKQLELEVKDNANRVLADDLRRMAGDHRVCLNENVVRRRALQEAERSAGNSNAATERPEPTENLGSAITGIVEECQRTTDKLIALQEFVRAERK